MATNVHLHIKSGSTASIRRPDEVLSAHSINRFLQENPNCAPLSAPCDLHHTVFEYELHCHNESCDVIRVLARLRSEEMQSIVIFYHMIRSIAC